MAKEHKKAQRNQLERLWLSELEARADTCEVRLCRAEFFGRVAYDENTYWLEHTRTLWQRLRWLFIG